MPRIRPAAALPAGARALRTLQAALAAPRAAPRRLRASVAPEGSRSGCAFAFAHRRFRAV